MKTHGFCVWWNPMSKRYTVLVQSGRKLTTKRLTIQVTTTSTSDGMFCGVGVVRRTRSGIWITA